MSGAGTGPPLDVVRLTGLQVRAHHGVFPEEKEQGQPFVVDLALHLDARRAGRSDALADTVDYGVLAQRVHDLVAGPPLDLLEAVAHRVALACLDDPRVAAAEVVLHKPRAPVPVPFGDVAVAVHRTREDHLLETAPAEPVDAVLSLGANLGDPAAALGSAVRALAAVDGLEVERASPVVETDPVGGPAQPAYLNAVLLVRTTLAPRALLDACHAVEAAHRRTRDVRWGARTLDVDIVAYDGIRSAAADLVLPHPRAHERGFVLVPWSAVDPGAHLVVDGVPRPVADLAAGTARQGVRPRPDVALVVGGGGRTAAASSVGEGA